MSTTTFGVGNDFDEALLQAMADAGGGHFYYIAGATQIRDHIASEVGETLEVVAQDVALELLAGEGVRVETISPHRLEARGTRTIVALGDLVSDQGVDVVLRLTFPFGDLGRETGLIVNLTDRDGVFAAAGVGDARLTWTWADDAANDAQPRDADVDRAVARQFAARARQQAVEDNRHARLTTRPQWWLTSTAKRIRKYAGRDKELRALVASSRRKRSTSPPRCLPNCSSKSTSRAPTSRAHVMCTAGHAGVDDSRGLSNQGERRGGMKSSRSVTYRRFRADRGSRTGGRPPRPLHRLRGTQRSTADPTRMYAPQSYSQ